MPTFAGRILTRREPYAGWITVESGKLTASGTGEPPEPPVAKGWIVPAPVNAHTHVADAHLRDRPGKPDTVRELFGPGGWKHQQLAIASKGEAGRGALAYAQEMAAVGTSHFIDFREGGLDGVRWLRNLELPVQPIIYGRGTKGFDEDEAWAVLEEADGIGISGLRDLRRRELDDWADACQETGKPLAVHVSEERTDDIHHAVSLSPHFVVHMTTASKADFQVLADERIPIVVCPRSNGHFGRRPDVAGMVEAECTVAVGTDNGMLQDGDLLLEASRLEGVTDEQRLRMITYHARQLAALPDPSLQAGSHADWIVLPEQPFGRERRKPSIAPIQQHDTRQP